MLLTYIFFQKLFLVPGKCPSRKMTSFFNMKFSCLGNSLGKKWFQSQICFEHVYNKTKMKFLVTSLQSVYYLTFDFSGDMLNLFLRLIVSDMKNLNCVWEKDLGPTKIYGKKNYITSSICFFFIWEKLLCTVFFRYKPFSYVTV